MQCSAVQLLFSDLVFLGKLGVVLEILDASVLKGEELVKQKLYLLCTPPLLYTVCSVGCYLLNVWYVEEFLVQAIFL